MRQPLRIPEKVRKVALTRGSAGAAWLAALPDAIADIAGRWGLTIGESPPNATEAFVAFARTEDGRDVVLKAVIAGVDPTRQEMRALRAADGRGYARLLRADETRNILLLERLGPQLHQLGISEDELLSRICATLRVAWMPQPEGPPFATGAEKAEELAAVIRDNWEALGRPCTQKAYGLALEFAARRREAFDPARSVLVHGDPHEWNTLQSPDSPTGFLFIDPDGAFAEHAFDLAIPMREWPNGLPDGDLLEHGRRRCARLAELTGVAPGPIWEWSLMQVVSNGLLLKQIEAEAGAAIEFALADAWAEAGDWV